MTSDKQRTCQQNKALHVWLDQVAKTLNTAGLDMRTVLEAKSVDVLWTSASVKEVLWRPVFKAMTTEESSIDASTKDYHSVCEVLTRHLGQNMGVALPPFPNRFEQGYRDYEGQL